MKSLRLIELMLISFREKKARQIKFHPNVTVIKGQNDVGKSCLVKSIYRALGAEVKVLDPSWVNAKVKLCLRFSLNGQQSAIIRDDKQYYLFDGNDELIGSFSSVTNELGPALADIFDFRIKLINQKDEGITPPPAFQFLPFYIDQDAGWQQPWNSFTNLAQLKKWRHDLTEYHLGLKPNEYYETKSLIASLHQKRDEPLRKYETLKSIRGEFIKRFGDIDLTFDIAEYKEEMKQILETCSAIQSEIQRYRTAIIDLYNQQSALSAQKQIVLNAAKQLRDDYQFASMKLTNDAVACPTCGAEYHNSFLERFQIARDEETVLQLAQDISHELREVDNRIVGWEEEKALCESELATLNRQLSEKRGRLELRELFEVAGKRELKKILASEMDPLGKFLSESIFEIEQLTSRLKEYGDKRQKHELKVDYQRRLRGYLMRLNVAIDDKMLESFYPKIQIQGSDNPRAILAYSLTMLSLMRESASSAFCPIVVDAINQQEQDEDNLRAMLTTLRDHRPRDSQLILGLVHDANVDMGGDIICLDDHRSVLQECEFPTVSSIIRPLLDKTLGE